MRSFNRSASLSNTSTSSSPALALAAELAQEMARRWTDGERPRAEEYLEKHPELGAEPEAAVLLIYEEICLRQDHGQEEPEREVFRRFPQWREQLEVLLDCHQLLQSDARPAAFPRVGDSWGGFDLLAQLGCGSKGRVFLATQPDLAGRPVVLKLTPADGDEHLSLARLQHTYIAPLYWAQHDPERNLRALCMPYFGGVTLSYLLDALKGKDPTLRSGQDVLAIVDEANASAPLLMPGPGAVRRIYARTTYPEAICGIGVRLADALQYAHERGLVHLDVKPSNILVASDGQPMLLDFHLAREPLRAGEPAPFGLGGTSLYLSPEQAEAMSAVRGNKPILQSVDGRSDIYSLGLVLYEALAGELPGDRRQPKSLHDINPGVSIGLADIVHKCIAPRLQERYQTAASLAADLGRHLSNQPLRGVLNRSWHERWRKWRRRRPAALALLALLAIAGTLALTGAWLSAAYRAQCRLEAETALTNGQQLFASGDYREASRVLDQGIERIRGIRGAVSLEESLMRAQRAAVAGEARRELHEFVDRVRFLYGIESLPLSRTGALETQCQVFWERRQKFLVGPEEEQARSEAQATADDLLELAVLWSDLRVRLARPQDKKREGEAAVAVLKEAERIVGGNLVLARERQKYADQLGNKKLAAEARQEAAGRTCRTAWEHYALGSSLLLQGDWAGAEAEFNRAREQRPQDFWTNFFAGTCAYRMGRHEDAVAAFGVCIALRPDAAECYYNRGLANSGLGRPERALKDYDRALEINPTFGMAALNRGVLRFRSKRFEEALSDLDTALTNGADRSTVSYDRALVYYGMKNIGRARSSLEEALRSNPENAQARELLERLR